MTREEQLDWLCRLRSEVYVCMPIEWLIPMNDALDMTIKTLEKQPCEDVLDKIRAEIEAKIAEPQYQHEEEDWKVGLIMAETIIDRYKAESEDKE